MQVAEIKIAREQAAELYRKYQEHRHYQTDVDADIARAYKEIARGKVVIRALESIRLAGLKEGGLPKLAIAPADAVACRCERSWNGEATMDARDPRAGWRHTEAENWRIERSFIHFPRDSFPRYPGHERTPRGVALVPPVPLHLRPKRGLANYHILWEAEWTRIPPHDPFLLRRIGKSDMWVVCAAWDLTEVERAALATRI